MNTKDLTSHQKFYVDKHSSHKINFINIFLLNQDIKIHACDFKPVSQEILKDNAKLNYFFKVHSKRDLPVKGLKLANWEFFEGMKDWLGICTVFSCNKNTKN